VRTKQICHTADAAADPFPGHSVKLGGARAIVCVPMLKDDQLAGLGGRMSKRILVVEDQPDNRQIIRDMLAGTDYEITEAKDGEASAGSSGKSATRSHSHGYPTADHGRLRGHAPNQGRSGVAVDSDHRRLLPRAQWGRTDSASGRM